MSTEEEHNIMKGIIVGNEAIIKSFYKENLSYIRKYILRNSGSEEDVEDVFQDAFIILYEKLKVNSLDLNSSLRTYFFSVCKNIWRNRLRKAKNLIIDNDVIGDNEELDTSTEDEIENKEKEHIYRKYFLALSTTCREVLGFVFDGLSMKHIAKKTGYAEGYVRKKKFDCKKHLIEMIENDSSFKELIKVYEKE